MVVFKNLDVCAKFKAEFVKIRGRDAGDEGHGAKGSGDAVRPGELVEVANNVGNHVLDKKARKAAEGKAVNTGTQTLFHGANGAFNLTDVAVGGNNIEGNRENLFVDAVKLIIGVHPTNAETTKGVGLENGRKVGENGAFVAIGDRSSGAVAQVAGDGVEEGNTLYVKKIGADGHVEVVVEEGGGRGTASN